MIFPKIRPYHPKDAHHIERYPESIMVGENHDNGYTLEVDDKILCCVGVDYYLPGLGTVWLIMSPEAYNYPRVVWALKSLLRSTMESCLRIQAYVRTDWPKAIRFVEYFGFELEGRLKSADLEGNDYYLYAIVR